MTREPSSRDTQSQFGGQGDYCWAMAHTEKLVQRNDIRNVAIIVDPKKASFPPLFSASLLPLFQLLCSRHRFFSLQKNPEPFKLVQVIGCQFSCQTYSGHHLSQCLPDRLYHVYLISILL